MPRRICETCNYLIQSCVCDLIPSVQTALNVIIFQDPNEANHSKNSVKLLKLALPPIRVVSVKTIDDILDVLKPLDLTKWCLIYPSEYSKAIEEMTPIEQKHIEGVILIDATWRKAFAMYHSCQEFLRVPTKRFLTPPKGRYLIRKTYKENALSTFEACVYTLECVEKVDLSIMKTFFIQAQRWQWRKMPHIQ
ncbi:DTW domain-containing protein [Marinomonas sp. 2405UD68-3]|uniref:DTW domain-containing protein n=1 Tax=Marinomonas sp. 2405UD68-3 TaxID=3391835 RepID=UPI0039C9010F